MDSIAIIGAKSIPKDFVGTSGVEAYIQEQLPKLIRLGTVVCYIRSWAQAHRRDEISPRVSLIQIPSINSKYLDTISYSFIASVHASLSKATIIWYHGIGPAFFSFIPLLFHKKVYTTVHSLDWERKKWNVIAKSFLKLCEKITIACSYKLFVVSESLKIHYQGLGRQDVLLEKYAMKKQTFLRADIITRKYGLKKDGYMLYIGRFVPEKRLEWLITASGHVSIPIVLAGGASHSYAYELELHQLATDKNIIFPGYVFGNEKQELLSNCRMFVLPSETEGFPISVSEALAYGKHCLVGDFLRGEYENSRLVAFFKTNDFRDFLHTLKRGHHSSEV